MPRLKLWRNTKTNDYKFFDRTISEFFFISGTQVFVHKFVGFTDDEGNIKDDIKIQDLLFMETRDRKYDGNVNELWGIYEVTDNDFELSQFGFFQSDTLYIDFHLNNIHEKLGRKLSAGDVLELSHLRDDMLDDTEGAINAFFVVEEGRWAADGYSATWLPHVWRVRVRKIFDSREYKDVLENANEDSEDDLEDMLSSYNKMVSTNETIAQEAEEVVPYGEEYADYIYDPDTDGALPLDPNVDIDEIPRVTRFPVDAEDGDYVIRKDYKPNQIFKYEDGTWMIVDRKILQDWTRGHDHTDDFVNNDEEFCDEDNNLTSQKAYISNPIKPIIDDEDDN
ncbi:hypothetical protein PBI_SCTP2_261 [Salicola phage SCTP-2]|nr:hypothetical protein PBI_SCTP2_261 [Salicola phage SCTP-2]